MRRSSGSEKEEMPRLNWRRFAQDDCGSLHAVGYLLLVTIIALGMIAGLATLRDGIVQEYGDIALALEHLDQSYVFDLPSGTIIFDDDTASVPDDPVDAAPYGIVLTTAPVGPGEQEALPVLPAMDNFPPATPGEGP